MRLTQRGSLSHALRGILPAMCLLLCAAADAAGPLLYIPLDEAWRLESRGAWQLRKDHRELLAMRHPWQPSENGAFAQATRTVSVPADWTGPVTLSFYCSDDFHTDTWRPDGTTLTAEGFIGHRFLQVLVNEKIVWSQDIANPVVQGQSPTFRVPLPVSPGGQFRLGLVVFDRLTSNTVTPEDFFQASDAATSREGHPEAANFQSLVYWGDLALVEGDAQAPPGKRPVEDRVSTVHERRWPVKPVVFNDAIGTTVTLTCDAPGGIPAAGIPLRFGIPFPPGKVSNPAQFRLQAGDGKALHADKEATATWPDGSLRWCLVDTLLPAATSEITLAFKKDSATVPRGASVKESEETLRLSSGALGVAASPGRMLHDLKLKEQVLAGEIGLVLQSGSERITGSVETVREMDDGPFRFGLLAQGTLQSDDTRFGRFHLYVYAYAGQPLLQLWLRVFNDTEQPLPVGVLALTLPDPDVTAAATICGTSVAGDFEVLQSASDTRTLRQASGETSLEPRAPFWVQAGVLTVVVPQVRERFPRGAQRAHGAVEIRLVDSRQSPVVLTPGEASTHDIWLAADQKDPAAFAAVIEQPPVLANPEYFCATGAFGPAWPVTGIPKYDEKFIAATKGQDWAALGARFGVRDFPDTLYFNTPGSWSNNYYNRTHGTWAAWLATGDAGWHARAIDVSRLVMDVAVIHSPVPGQDWLGGIHGPGPNHVPGPWSPTLRTRGLWLYDMLTGAPEAAEAYMGAADFVARRGLHQQSPSVRDHAGPMDAIVTAYDASGEPQWLDEGSKRVAWAWEHMDRRRGTWPETHGSMVYRGNVPWMVAQLAGPLFEWYNLTGDVEAAQQVVGMAESMICENTPWDQPGAISGYSHNPHFQMTAAYDPLIIPILFAAYELTEDTFFLDAAKAQWKRWEQDPVMDSAFNTFWHTPWLASCIKRWMQE